MRESPRDAIAQVCSHGVHIQARIIIRMKGLPNTAIEREVKACTDGRIKRLVHLIYINRKGAVVDMK